MYVYRLLLLKGACAVHVCISSAATEVCLCSACISSAAAEVFCAVYVSRLLLLKSACAHRRLLSIIHLLFILFLAVCYAWTLTSL